MVRKSRSHSRSRSRSRSKDRSHHKHHKYHKSQKSSHSHKRSDSRTRSRSRSPRQKSRSPKPSKYRSSKKSLSPLPSAKSTIDSLTLGGGLTLGNVKPKVSLVPMTPFLDPQTLEGKTGEEIEMMKLLGFSSFDTTKGKHVDGSCNASGANIQQKRRYRQYMNRKGGFNRPLDPIA